MTVPGTLSSKCVFTLIDTNRETAADGGVALKKGITAFTGVNSGAATRLTSLSTGLGLFLSLSEINSTPVTGMSPPTLSRLSHHKGSNVHI